MKSYKIYNKNVESNIEHDGDHAFIHVKEDKTIINFSITGYTLNYQLSNLSDRTQYLLDNDRLGILVIVEDNWQWFVLNYDVNGKSIYRGPNARCHLKNHSIQRIHITNTSGTINLWHHSNGSISKVLYHKFDTANTRHDPEVSSGYERIKIGIGRCRDIDGYVTHIRPYKISKTIQITVQNLDY